MGRPGAWPWRAVRRCHRVVSVWPFRGWVHVAGSGRGGPAEHGAVPVAHRARGRRIVRALAAVELRTQYGAACDRDARVRMRLDHITGDDSDTSPDVERA